MALTNEIPTDLSAGGAPPAAEGKAKPDRKSKAAAKGAAEVVGSSRKDAAVGKTIKSKATPPALPAETKTSIVLKKLNSPKGVTIEMLMDATAWQAHSVRGFLSAVVKKKLGLTVINETGKDGVRRYRIDDATKTSK